MTRARPSISPIMLGAQTQGPRSCRSAILPGAGCAKFIDLAAAQKLTQTRAETLALPRSRWQPAQDGRAPPKDPPPDGVTRSRRAKAPQTCYILKGNPMLTRRAFTASAVAFGLSACAKPPSAPATRAATENYPKRRRCRHSMARSRTSPIPFRRLPTAHCRRNTGASPVPNPWPNEPSGTIIVDPDAGNLHVVQDRDIALRYGVSVWCRRVLHGPAWRDCNSAAEWPRWKVPAAMIARQPELARFSVANGGMDPGPDNPMGCAGVIILFQDGVDTAFIAFMAAPEARDIGARRVVWVYPTCSTQDVDRPAIDKGRFTGPRSSVLTSLAPQDLGAVFSDANQARVQHGRRAR